MTMRRMLFRQCFAVALAWALASSGPIAGQLGGTAAQVNTTTLGDQIQAEVAIAADGTTLVVWESGFTVRGRLFDPIGQPMAADFEIAAEGLDPAVAAEPYGGFIVVWVDASSIWARRLGSGGALVGEAFLVSPTENSSADPRVAVAPTGDVLVSWDSLEVDGGPTGGSTGRIHVRHFDAAGVASAATLVDEVTCVDLACDTVDNGGVVSGANGEFVIAWERNLWYLTPLSEDILVSRFASDGAPVGTELVVRTDAVNYHDAPSIAYADDHYLVVWDSDDPMADGAGRGVRGRLLDGDGDPVGAELQINTSTLGDQRLAVASAYPSLDSSFLVVWQDEGSVPTTVRGQAVGLSGLVGTEIALTTIPPGEESRPAADHGTVVWESQGSTGDDAEGSSVQGRVLARPFVFADGFESGDLSAWSGAS